MCRPRKAGSVQLGPCTFPHGRIIEYGFEWKHISDEIFMRVHFEMDVSFLSLPTRVSSLCG